MRILLLVLALVATSYAELKLVVDRKINLQTQNARHESKVTLTNAGQEEVTTVKVAFEKPVTGSTAWMRVVNNKRALRLTPVDVDGADGQEVFSVKLNEPLGPGQTTNLLVKQVITHAQVPKPKSIPQHGQPYVVYEFNAYFPSAYKVAEQTTKVTVSEGFKDVPEVVKPMSKSGSVATFGPFKDIAPFTTKTASAHYKSTAKFLTVYEMVREVTISHWGRSKVEEIIKLRHDGPLLQGIFSRADWMHGSRLPHHGAPGAITEWTTELPAEAWHVEYRDDIGNISTSHLRKTLQKQQLQLIPRFPLFGGWKTDYMLNYTVPTNLYLKSAGDHYSLKLNFLSHVFDNVVVDDFTLRIVLPEGSSNINFKVKFAVNEEARDVKATYLDTSGRPVVVVRKANLVDEHMADCEVTYDFELATQLNKPAILIAAYMVLFVVFIVWQRLDFSISADEVGPVTSAKKLN